MRQVWSYEVRTTLAGKSSAAKMANGFVTRQHGMFVAEQKRYKVSMTEICKTI